MSITTEMLVPPWVTGEISCTAPNQSGAVYFVPATAGAPFGSTITVDLRDVPALQLLGFITTGSPSESP